MIKFYFSVNEFCIFISCIFLWNSGVTGLLCHCDEHCPDNHVNFTCYTEYKCFSTIEMIKGTKLIDSTMGCMPPEHEGGMFQCRSKEVRHQVPLTVECCNDKDFCNEELQPTLPPEQVNDYVESISEPKTSYKVVNHTRGIALVVSVTVCVMLLVIAATYFYLKYRQIRSERKRDAERKMFIPNGTSRINSLGELLDITGTGSGIPILTQRTIAKEIIFYQEIGRGRFSSVFKGRWRQQIIAIKVVNACDEKSWERELQIFQSGFMCHENVLGFVAGDYYEFNPAQELQRVIVTEYHPYGSLYDFLQAYSFDYRILLRLAYSAVSGLSFTHRMIAGSRGKPAIAHRDITSKNILVKENLQCCIADFGLALKFDNDVNNIEYNDNQRLPTIRYMAPEIIEKPNGIFYTFETYQQADIYAFGLVLWEITRRYEVKGIPEKHALPFSDYVSDEPSLKEMHDVIIINQITPKLPTRYESDEYSKLLLKLMRECWHFHSSARLTSQYIKKSLQKFLQDQDSEESVGSSTGTASTGIS